MSTRFEKYDQRIVIESPTVTRGPTGAQVTSWTTQLTVWAMIEDVSSREMQDSSRTQSERRTRFKIRHSAAASAIEATWRITHGGRTYDIEPPTFHPTGRPERIEILATQRGAAA